MGKRGNRADRIKVFEAAEVVEMAQHAASWERLPNRADFHAYRACGKATLEALRLWHRAGRVVLSIDPDFAQALARSDTAVELVPDWLARLPYGTFIGSLAKPLAVHDGLRRNVYLGFIVCGIVTNPVAGRDDRVWTSHRPFAAADGFRFVWFYRSEDQPGVTQAQTLTWNLRGPYAQPRTTLGDLVNLKKQLADIAPPEAGDQAGEELPILLPLSVQLLLYLAATEPEDVHALPAARLARPQQLKDATVVRVGWRVGADLRGAAKVPSGEQPTGVADPRRKGGWRLAPHFRRAHWARRRVATRDTAGRIVGNVHGEQGVDWRYELRWLPPTPVALLPGKEPGPVIRDVRARPAT